MDEALDTFSIRLAVAIRPCRAGDLAALELLELPAAQHAALRPLFARQAGGESLVLVADVQGQAVGQLCIDLQRRRAERAGEIWAVHVLPCLRNQGIGARLLRSAEALLQERGLRWALLGVEGDNPRARCLYERLGYTLAATVPAAEPARTTDAASSQWVLRKELPPRSPTACGPGA